MAESNETKIGSKVDGNDNNGNDGGSPDDRPTPAQRLAQLQTELIQQNEQLADLTEDNKRKKSDEAILRKLVADLEKVVDEYGKGTVSYRSKLDHFRVYAENKGQMIAAAIKDKIQEINAARSRCQLQLDGLKRDFTLAEKTLNTTKNEHDKAKADFEQKTGIFENFKILKKMVEDNLAGIQDLKTEIETKECENKFGVMDFLFQDLQQLRSTTESRVMDKDTFRNKLNNYWADMNDAQTAFRNREVAWLDAKEIYESKKKTLQEAETSFRAKLIEELGKIQF